MGLRGAVRGAAAATVVAVLLAGCDASRTTLDPTEQPEPTAPEGSDLPPDGTGGSGADPDDSPQGNEAPPPPPPNTGPWPTEAVLDYSERYGVGTPQSVGLDEGLNLWLLDGDRIGVLRPGKDTRPVWTRGVGQASEPFGPDSLAMGSTVICGGEAGRAYVGYRANEMKRAPGIEQRTYIPAPGEPGYTPERYAEYQKGDLDAVRVQEDGTVVLEEHLWRTTSSSSRGRQIGIHNTNDFHYEEDRSVFNCARVTHGRHRGDLYITTNHGVTRIQGLVYNSHRHPGWYLYEDGSEWGSLQCPPMHGLGIAPNGDVLVANEQMLGVLVPSDKLEEWDRENTWAGPTPWTFKGFNSVLNGQATDDSWRAFEQTESGQYYLGSEEYGVWRLTPTSRSAGEWLRIAGLPTDRIRALKAVGDVLFIGTDGAGLWKLEADGVTVQRVDSVDGKVVKQLVYEPSVEPAMLLVLTDAGLTVLR